MTCLPESPGILLVQVIVTDSNGGTANSSLVAIDVNPALSVTAPTVSGSHLASENLTFRVNVTGGSPPIRYDWNFGDGSSGAGFSAVHAYRAAGTYSVHIIVNDSAGSSIVETLTLKITAPPSSTKTETTFGLPDGVFYALIAIVGVVAVLGVFWATRARRRPPRPAQGRSPSPQAGRRPAERSGAAPQRPSGIRPRSGTRPPLPRPPSKPRQGAPAGPGKAGSDEP